MSWHGKRDVRVDTVPDPAIREPTDAIVRVTTTAICGSDLHLYEVLGPFLEEGGVLGHEPMGIVEAVGSEVTHIQPGDGVVVPPTAWQAVEYADIPEGGSVAVLGLGPIGQFCCRIAAHRGAGKVIGVDLVSERLDLARQFGAVPHGYDIFQKKADRAVKVLLHP